MKYITNIAAILAVGACATVVFAQPYNGTYEGGHSGYEPDGKQVIDANDIDVEVIVEPQGSDGAPPPESFDQTAASFSGENQIDAGVASPCGSKVTASGGGQNPTNTTPVITNYETLGQGDTVIGLVANGGGQNPTNTTPVIPNYETLGQGDTVIGLVANGGGQNPTNTTPVITNYETLGQGDTVIGLVANGGGQNPTNTTPVASTIVAINPCD